MDAQTMQSGIDKIMARATDRLRTWWDEFVTVDPALAAQIRELDVVTDAAFRRRGGDPTRHSYAGFPGWIWFDEGEVGLSKFTIATIGGVFAIGQPLIASLADLLIEAGDRRDKGLTETIRGLATAYREWTVADVEVRLGMTIGAAYACGACIPLWSDGLPSGRHPYPITDVEEFRRREPREFLFGCAEGLLHEDPSWMNLTSLLLRPQTRPA